MEKDLNIATTAGVFAEYCDASGNLVAQEVFFDWRDAPLPAIGELLACTTSPPAEDRPSRIVGRVRSRYFDVQRGEDGQPQVWVRLVLDVCPPRPAASRRWEVGCSLN